MSLGRCVAMSKHSGLFLMENLRKRGSTVCLAAMWLVAAGLLPGSLHAATHSVSVVSFAFQPQTITVDVGDTVTWTNNSATFHTVTSGTGCVGDGLWDASLPGNGQTFSRTFPTPGTYPYFCIPHCLAFGMTGTVIVNGTVTLPAPAGQQTFFFLPVETPVVGASKAASRPIGIGPLAAAGTILTVEVALAPHEIPVDLYAAFTVSTDPLTLVNIGPDLSFQSITLQQVVAALASGTPPAGVVPWMSAVSAGIDVTLFAGVPVSALGAGQYTAYLLVTPHGGSLVNFDLYETTFTIF